MLSVLLLVLSLSSHGSEKSICGPSDDRELSSVSPIGRLSSGDAYMGCTVTMIGERCAISAGHCDVVFDRAEFNTLPSENEEPVPSAPEDTYFIDKDSIVFENLGPGQDWAVFKIKANEITGKLAGSVQGYYSVSMEKPTLGETLRITGYGVASGNSTGNFAQQTHTGELLGFGHIFFNNKIIRHGVDTMGGNSGSTIISEGTQQVVGIHTHGGCRERGGSNMGSTIYNNTDLQDAILSCLESE